MTIIDKLTEDRRHDISHRILYSLVLGFLCYLSYYYLLLLIYETILGGQVAFTFFDSLTTSKPLNFKEIAVVSIYSIFIGYFCAAFINYKILFRFARFIKVSKKISDSNIWDYIMNSPKATEWVIIRDSNNDIMYEGWIEAFSDPTRRDEVFLRDVKIFKNSTGLFLYEMPAVYLSKNRDDLVFEFPSLEFSDLIKRDHQPGNDIWKYIMNLSEPTEYITIRDLDKNIRYSGQLEVGLNSNERNELFMRNVTVYDNKTNDLLYEAPAMFISKETDNLIFEFPRLKIVSCDNTSSDLNNINRAALPTDSPKLHHGTDD